MKVLLVRPPVPRYTIGLKHVMICEPLELEYVAAGLDGHQVQILDLIIERDFPGRLRRFQPDVVGLSCYITGVNEVIKLCRHVKRWNPECLTIVGGVHASVAPEDFADPTVDVIALGDGAAVMPRVVEAWEQKRALFEIPGLALPSGPKRVVRTEDAVYMSNPDQLPLPRRDLTGHLRRRYYYLFHQPVAIMKTTWGCWYDCRFCMTWKITGGKTYSRSPESIVRELETIKEPEVYIVDDIFLINPSRLLETARLIRERGIHKNFLVYGRSDFVAQHEAVIKEWADIGLTAVIVGLEADTRKELAGLGKQTTPDHNRSAIEVLRRNRIDIYASLIPQPSYDKDEWRKLFSFIEEAKLYYVNISPLTPLPGSPIFKAYEPQLTIPRQAHPLWDLTHCVLPTRLTLKQYYRELLRIYARTVLSIRRANRLTLRTRPPVWSRQYLRLWLGAVQIFFQFINAHRHHNESNLKKAMDRGTPVDGLEYRGAKRPAESDSHGHLDLFLDQKDKKQMDTENKSPFEIRHPVDPYAGYFMIHPDQRENNDLVNIPAAQRWRTIVSWGIRKGLYAYQQPFQMKSGSICSLDGKDYRMVSSYDYLGLLGHPRIEAASREAVSRYGTGAGGVRLLTGSTALHYDLDQRIADFKKVEASLSFSSGYIANLAVISALFNTNDRIIADSRIHRSVSDACRMARIQMDTFEHNDVQNLIDILRKSDRQRRTLVVVEGVYSMDGDICPLPDIVAQKEKYGFTLMVDEAHSFGALGATGRGIDEHFGLPAEAVDIWMGSLSKAIPSCGGFIAGSRELIIYLHHGSAPFMFSAAAAPATVAAALEALNVLEEEPERLSRLAENAAFLRQSLAAMSFDIGQSNSQVIPVILGSDEATYLFSHALFQRGTVALGVVSPAVKRGSARLRLCATAAQDREFLAQVADDFKVCREEMPSHSRKYKFPGRGKPE